MLLKTNSYKEVEERENEILEDLDPFFASRIIEGIMLGAPEFQGRPRFYNRVYYLLLDRLAKYSTDTNKCKEIINIYREFIKPKNTSDVMYQLMKNMVLIKGIGFNPASLPGFLFSLAYCHIEEELDNKKKWEENNS